MDGADVCGPGGNNAVPAMVQSQFGVEAPLEVVGFSDIASKPYVGPDLLAEDVNAGTLEIVGPDRMKLERIGPESAGPVDELRRRRSLS